MDLKKVGTLGGQISVNKENSWMYGNTPHMSKEVLFGKAGCGPLHPGMPDRHKMALDAVRSDTRQTLVRELASTEHFTKREAEEVIDELIAEGYLVEAKHPKLGKILLQV